MQVLYKQSVLAAGTIRSVEGSLQDILGRCNVWIRCFDTSEECLTTLDSHPYDLLVVCMNDDPRGGFELVMQSTRKHPSTPILVLVKQGDVSLAVQVLKAGAADCREMPVQAAELRSTVLGLLGQYRAGERGADLGLTKTESLVLAHILEGRANRAIADVLHRSPRTIEVHRKTIMRKLGVSNVVGLFRQAASMGLTAPRPPFAQSDSTRHVGT